MHLQDLAEADAAKEQVQVVQVRWQAAAGALAVAAWCACVRLTSRSAHCVALRARLCARTGVLRRLHSS
jgi:hypothetical protein